LAQAIWVEELVVSTPYGSGYRMHSDKAATQIVLDNR